jgi:hypothetical protein
MLRYDLQVMIGLPNVPASQWLTPLLSAALAGVGAWIGGKFSVQREIEKTVKQRAFDQRLEWYVRVSKTLGEMQFLFAALNRPNVTRDKALQILEKISQMTSKLNADIREALLFGSPEIIRSLDLMNRRIVRFMLESIESADSGGPSGAPLVEIDREFGRVYNQLALDTRRHLGLEDLPASYFQIKEPERSPN